MTNIETIFDYKTTINISFDIDNYNEEDIIKIIKEKFNIIKQCKTEDIDETIAKAQAIEDFNCDCYACISGSNKSCVR
jgi:hypothetical protein|tara:strand:+ start:175 stop:408 length:234 start_codon:yes stop_codon:yes gene_type:complete